MLLKSVANAITNNYNDIHLMVCLIGERPEEVTDMRHSVRGEVIAATFDEPVENQTRVADLALERAKRIVEGGRDVVVLLDGIHVLTRAYNLSIPPSGRTLSGGVDPAALYPPKRFFGTARNTAEGGIDEYHGSVSAEFGPPGRRLCQRCAAADIAIAALDYRPVAPVRHLAPARRRLLHRKPGCILQDRRESNLVVQPGGLASRAHSGPADGLIGRGAGCARCFDCFASACSAAFDARPRLRRCPGWSTV